jgi:hypothetical protein
MKTAVSGEDDQAHIVYNRALIDFAGHYRFHPKACACTPRPGALSMKPSPEEKLQPTRL